MDRIVTYWSKPQIIFNSKFIWLYGFIPDIYTWEMIFKYNLFKNSKLKSSSMRFLKRKIARALELSEMRFASQTASESSGPSSPEGQAQEIASKLRIRVKDQVLPNPSDQVPHKKRSAVGNNIVKNYSRAMVNFGLSDMARPFMEDKPENGLSYERFRQILNCKKRNVNCIRGLRCLLLEDKRDSEEMRQWKAMFQRCCEVFLKYFCVNWIWNSKIGDRLRHLRYRGKILRRVRNPEQFTNLESFARSSYWRRKNFWFLLRSLSWRTLIHICLFFVLNLNLCILNFIQNFCYWQWYFELWNQNIYYIWVDN